MNYFFFLHLNIDIPISIKVIKLKNTDIYDLYLIEYINQHIDAIPPIILIRVGLFSKSCVKLYD